VAAAVVVAVELVDDGLHLVAVVLLGGGVDVGPVVVLWVRHAVRFDCMRVDLRSEEVVDAVAARPRAIDDV